MTNTADKTLRIGGSITAGEMVYVFKREDIEPGSTIILDVDKWRQDQVPDVNGKTLPLNAPYGKIHWIEMGLGKNAGLLGRTSLASVQNHRRSSFSCGSSCAFDADGYPYFDSSPFTTLLIENSLTTNASEHMASQNGSSYTYPYNFSSDSMRISTSGVVGFSNGSQSTQLIETGVGYGNTNLDYDFTFNNPTYDPDEEVCDDNYETEDVGGSSDVPSVSISGSRLVLASGTGGASSLTSIQLTATGSPGGGTYSWSQNGNLSLTNQTTSTVTVSGSSGGNFTLKVTYTLNGVSVTASQVETVQQPSSNPVTSDTENHAATGCPAGYAGWTRSVLRKLTDMSGAPILASGLAINESFTVAPNQLGITASSIGTGTGGTDAYGQSPDRFSFCSTACPTSSSATLNQSETQGTYQLATSVLVYSCNSITVR